MTEAEFLDFARCAALRATSNIGRIRHLVCIQARNPKEPTLREPELRAAFEQEAEERSLYYGIEVRTVHTCRFVDKEGLNETGSHEPKSKKAHPRKPFRMGLCHF